MILGFTPDQLVEIAKAVGPILLSIVGAVVMALLSAIGWGLRVMWRTHKRQMAQASQALKALADGAETDRKEREAQILSLKEGLMGVRAEVALTSRGTQDALARVLEMGGMIRLQQEALEKNNGLLERVNGKLEAMFRFIDAPRRATDVANLKG
jgi:hypothetical protein